MAKGKSKTTKTTAKRSSAGSSSKSGSRRMTKAEIQAIESQKSFFQSELTAIVVMVLGGFLLLTDLGLMGSLGEWLLGVQKGLFGQGFFLLAAAIVAAAFVGIKYKDSYFVGLKIACVFGGLLDIAAIMHLMFAEEGAYAMTAGELYRDAAEGGSGGGMIGGVIVNTLQSVVGHAGTYLVLVALLIAFAVIITEKSFVRVAKIGAEKTADVVKDGAGRTLKAAKDGHERYQQIHREHVIRRDARREEERLRRLEDEFETNRRMTMDQISLGSETLQQPQEAAQISDEAADAAAYADYGREIIGDNQPGISSLENIREPFFRPDISSNRSRDGVSFDTAVIGDTIPEPEQEAPKEAVTIRQIDYDSDEIPFEETKEEAYKSYAYILDGDIISIDAARQNGYAVGRTGAQNLPGDARVSVHDPEHFDAFKPRPEDSENVEIPAAETAPSEETGFGIYSYTDAVTPGAESAALSYGDQDQLGARDGFDDTDRVGAQYSAGDAYGTGEQGEMTGTEPFDDSAEGAWSYPYDTAETENDPAGTRYPDAAKTQAGDPQSTAETMQAAADPYYRTAAGKTMKAPDEYEASAILARKLGETGAAGAAGAANAGRGSSSDGAGSVRTPGTGIAAGALSAGTAAGRPGPSNAAGRPVSSAAAAAKEKPIPKPKPKPYVPPTLNLLEKGDRQSVNNRETLRSNAQKLEKVLRDFGVGVTVTNVVVGPRVSRYELTPDAGVKVSRITSLSGDIKLALAAREIRIEAPIPGKSAVGVEVPNEKSSVVKFRDILESEELKNAKSKLSWGIGLDIGGNTVVCDIAKMPHILVAGTTGSGKSVGINSLIMSILYRATPEEVKMILVDPKQVEFTVYNGIPHLLTEVVTTPEKALSALNWAVAEMNRRYKLFQQSGTRNIAGYNEKIGKVMQDIPEEERPEKLPFILIIIDELSELMMHAKKDVESCIVSLAQLARAAGIHLVVATQRPSVDVVTGLIKSNIPSRVAFKLPSVTDSRTILDAGGAETLLGNGDMLYKPGDKGSAIRVQGAFLSDDEVENVVSFIRKHNQSVMDPEIGNAIEKQMAADESSQKNAEKDNSSDFDEYFAQAGRLIITSQKASIGGLQRKFKVGFNRAARIMDQLCDYGVVSSGEGTKERQILMDIGTFEEMLRQLGC